MSRVAGLVLAAGESRRLGRPKALVELHGERLVDRAVRTLREGGCDPVYVVAGAVPLTPAGAHVVDNPDWPTGMASSLGAGLRAASAGDAGAVVVALVDQPGLGPETVRRLRAAHAEGAVAAVATYAGERRNPVLLDRSCWDLVSTFLDGDTGARPFLQAYPEMVTAVECGDVGDPADIDTQEDLEGFTRAD